MYCRIPGLQCFPAKRPHACPPHSFRRRRDSWNPPSQADSKTTFQTQGFAVLIWPWSSAMNDKSFYFEPQKSSCRLILLRSVSERCGRWFFFLNHPHNEEAFHGLILIHRKSLHNCFIELAVCGGGREREKRVCFLNNQDRILFPGLPLGARCNLFSASISTSVK